MQSLANNLKRERRKTVEALRADPADQSLRWTLADIQNSILAVEAVIAELAQEEEEEQDARDLVIL